MSEKHHRKEGSRSPTEESGDELRGKNSKKEDELMQISMNSPISTIKQAEHRRALMSD